MLFDASRTPGFLLALAATLGLSSLPALAEDSPANSANETAPKEVLVAELAEDEDVEDIEQSAPLESTLTEAAQEPDTDSDTGEQAMQEEPAQRVAPNIDLKEVVPEPKPSATVTRPEQETGAGTETEEGPETVQAEPVLEKASSFTLLGSEVMPGTSTRLAWSPGIQIAGLSQPTPVLVVNGVNAGPTLCLTGAVHGDELNGIEIIRRTVYDLNPEKLSGRVVGIPIVNLPGFQQASRYLPDRRDLNRHFPGSETGSLADRIAHSLFENIIRRCDMLVDIHTGSLKRTNLPQLRADMNNPDVARFTRGFDRMAVVHSSGSAGMLRTAAVEAGITTVTMEAGESHRIQEHQIEAGVNSLTSLMERQGMISRMFVWGDPEPVYYDSDWIRADHGGILFSEVELGANVSEGEILGYVADPITNAQHPIRSTSKGRIIGMAVDQVVMAGFAAYHIGTEAEVPGE